MRVKRGLCLILTLILSLQISQGIIFAAPMINLREKGDSTRILGDFHSGLLGWALAYGDINADKIEDLIISGFADKSFLNQKVYVFYGHSSLSERHIIDLSTEAADITIIGKNSHNRETGIVLASADINGDGIDDIIIGAPLPPIEPTNQRAETYVIYGRKDFPPNYIIDLNSTQPDITILGQNLFNHKKDDLGTFVVSGDVNNDGLDDLIISAPTTEYPDEPTQTMGAVYIIFGNLEYPSRLIIDIAQPPATELLNSIRGKYAESIGTQLCLADINGDSIKDIIIAAISKGTIANMPDPCRVYVFYGKSGLKYSQVLNTQDADVVIKGAVLAPDYLGQTMGFGDINGDKIEDMLLGVRTSEDMPIFGYVVYGDKNLPSTIDLTKDHHSTVIEIERANYRGEHNLHNFSSADINGDTIDDLIIGVFDEPPNSPNMVYVFYGKKSGFPAVLTLKSADIAFKSNQIEDLTGFSVGGTDINNDGVEDLIIGAPGAKQESFSDVGEVFIIYGKK